MLITTFYHPDKVVWWASVLPKFLFLFPSNWLSVICAFFSQLISSVYWIFNYVTYYLFCCFAQISDVKIIVNDGPHSIIRSRVFFRSFSQYVTRNIKQSSSIDMKWKGDCLVSTGSIQFINDMGVCVCGGGGCIGVVTTCWQKRGLARWYDTWECFPIFNLFCIE